MSTTDISALADRIRAEMDALDATRGRLQAAYDELTQTSAKTIETPRKVSKPRTNGSRRAASGATRAAVIEALRNHPGSTATEIAGVTGLGRGSISTTLSKLASKGVATRMARGYAISE